LVDCVISADLNTTNKQINKRTALIRCEYNFYPLHEKITSSPVPVLSNWQFGIRSELFLSRDVVVVPVSATRCQYKSERQALWEKYNASEIMQLFMQTRPP